MLEFTQPALAQIGLSDLGIALGVSTGIVLLALWRGWLSPSGGVGALLVGTIILGVGGWMHGALLFAFFFSSSLLSRLKRRAKEEAADQFDKGSRRDMGQVLTNGGPGAFVVLLGALLPGTWWTPLFIGIFSSVTADTWATELGTLSRQAPRLITTGKVVAAGRSGGVTPLGLMVSCIGGMLIGLVAGLWPLLPLASTLIIGGVSGLCGSLLDSLLGATLQRLYLDPTTQTLTEKSELAGQPLAQIRGWAWMSNDVVNLIASMGGGGVALLLTLAVSR